MTDLARQAETFAQNIADAISAFVGQSVAFVAEQRLKVRESAAETGGSGPQAGRCRPLDARSELPLRTR